MKPRDLIPLTALLSVAGCMSFNPEHADRTETYIPANFSEPSGSAELPNHWWESFDSAELDALMQEALGGNLGLAQYSARLKQQAALARKTGASSRPSLSGSASAGTTWPDITESARADAYRLGLSASYEIDLWGRISASKEAALNGLEASRYDFQGARLSLSANITQSWLTLIAQQRQLALLKEQLESNLDSLNLLKVRQKNGIVTALEVYQQQQIVESTRAMIPSAELQLELQKSQLAVLLGRSNSSDIEIKTVAAPTLPLLPATGLPSDLLLNRPDLLAEYERLSAKEYGVAIARADRLPALTLTGSLTDSESQIADLLDNWAGNLAAGLVAPLIDGGRRKAEVEYQLARIEEGVALYRQKVITAISEVDNALLQERKTAEQLTAQRRQLAVLNQQLNEAQIRYRNSLVDYLNVISALTSKQSMERTLINTELSLYSTRIELYRALGGGAQ